MARKIQKLTTEDHQRFADTRRMVEERIAYHTEMSLLLREREREQEQLEKLRAERKAS